MLKWITNNWMELTALGFSIMAFVHTYWLERINLKISNKTFELPSNDKDEIDEYNLYADFIIENRSKYPITILKIKFNNSSSRFDEMTFGSASVRKCYNQIIIGKKHSTKFPFKLEAYEAFNDGVLFSSKDKIELKKMNLLRIYTTRGVIFFFISRNNFFSNGNNTNCK